MENRLILPRNESQKVNSVLFLSHIHVFVRHVVRRYLCWQTQPMATLTLTPDLPRGNYAIVFTDSNPNRVIKLFKSSQYDELLSNSASLDEGIDDETRDIIFGYEREAYEIAMQSESLRLYIPEFFGSAPIEAVLTPEGDDVSKAFLLGCNLVIERIVTPLDKIGPHRGKPNVASVLRQFAEAGITHTEDADITFVDETFVLVDFATQDVELWA